MKTIYILGYNIYAVATAIILRNFFGYNADVRIVDLKKQGSNIPVVMDSKLIKIILDLNDISVEQFLKETNGVPVVGSVYKNFYKRGSLHIKTNDTANEDLLVYKKALNPKMTSEEEIEYTSKLASQLKGNLIDKNINDDYAFTFDSVKATNFLCKEVFQKKLQGRIIDCNIKNIVFKENGYIEFLETSINRGLPLVAGLYIDCSDDLFKHKPEQTHYNNSLITASFPYKNKEEQIINSKCYIAKDNGYIMERCLWNRIEVNYFFNKHYSTGKQATFVIGDHILKSHKIYYKHFDIKDIVRNSNYNYYNKDVIDFTYDNNWVEPLVDNPLDILIKKVFKLVDLFEDGVIFSQMYKNHFNEECRKIDREAEKNYLMFLSKTENNYNSYWNKIFEADVVTVLDLKNCVKDIIRHKTFDPEYYEKLWEKELLFLDNYNNMTDKLERTITFMERINK